MNILKKDSSRDKLLDKKTLNNKTKNSSIMSEIFKSILINSFMTFILFMLGWGYFMYNQNLKHTIAMLDEQSKYLSTEISHYFKDISALINVTAYSRSLKGANEIAEEKSHLLKLLQKVESDHDGIKDIVVAYNDNSQISNNNFLPKDYNIHEAEWYKKAIKTNNSEIIVEQIPDHIGINELRLLVSKSFMMNGKNKGVILVECWLDSLYNLISPEPIFTTNTIFLVNKSDKKILSKNQSITETQIINNNSHLFNNTSFTFTEKINDTKFLIFSNQIPNLDWFIVSRIHYSEITNNIFPRVLLVFLILCSLLILASKLVAYIIGRKFAKPVIEVSEALQKLAIGDKDIQPMTINSHNEIGMMAESFNTFLENTNVLKSDIIELKETQEQLSYMLSLFNASLESTDDGVLVLDNDKKVIKCNKVFLELLQVTEKDFQSGSNKFLINSFSNLILDFNNFLATVIKTRNNLEIVTLDILEFVSGLIIECTSFPQRLNDKVVGRVWRCRDITELRNAELALENSEERHRVMFTETVDAYGIIDGEKILDVNDATLKMLNMTREVVLSSSLTDLCPKYQQNGELSEDAIKRLVYKAFELGKVTTEFELLRSDGIAFPGEMSVVKINLKGKDLILTVWKDLTEEKRIAEDLKISEENFRLFFESMLDMLFVSNYQGNIRYINQATQDKLGYSFSELTSMTVRDLHPELIDQSLPEIMEYLMAGKGEDCSLPLKTKDGSLISVESKTWIGKWDGEDCLFGVSKDITKEKEALDKFNKIFESNPDALTITNFPEKKFSAVNDVFCEITGYTKEEVIGKTAEELNLPKKLGELFTNKGSFANVTLPLMTKTGELVEGLFSGETMVSNGERFFLTTMSDITEVKRLDRMLVKSEHRYHLLFENMTTGFALHEMIYDDNGVAIDYKFLNINPAYEKITGLKAKQVNGRRITEILPEAPEYWIETFDAVIKTGQSVTHERYYTTFDRSFEIRAFPFEPNKFAVILSDNTVRAKALKSLEKEKELAQTATKAKSEFLANMSHEIRTPLNGVIGFTDLLLSTDLSPSQKQFSSNANISGKALLGIINDILDFSKIEAGKMELDPVNYSISEVVEQAVDIIKFSACKKKVDVIINIPNVFPEEALIDPLRLKQILLNLLNNAVKFTSVGEIEISVKFTPNEQNTGNFMFSVRDTGIGISEKASKRLFHAFSQADNSITRKYGGTGLGLVISSFLADKMGATIEFESEEGKGSNFYFTISTEYFGKSKDRKDSLKGNKILIADKNTRFMEVMKDKFEYWGIEVELATTENEILEKAHSSSYKILLLDERILNHKKYDLIDKKVASSKSSKDKTCSVITTCPNDNIKVVQVYKEFDITEILTKPLMNEDLYKSIHDICTTCDIEDDKDKKPLKNLQTIVIDRELEILIAEDVEMNMILIKTLVKKIIPNAKIHGAKNGMEAVHRYKKYLPDLILMDLQMPELDGIEATKAIKKLEQNSKSSSNIPIIALTAAAFNDDKVKCLNAGMVDFLTKPISVKELTNVLEKYLLK